MLTLIAPIPTAHSTARVTMVTREMGSSVLVSNLSLLNLFCSFPPFATRMTNISLYQQVCLLKRSLFLFTASFSDVNECFPNNISEKYSFLAHNCHADANCTNTLGSFYCTCHSGYAGNGITCEGKCSFVFA